MPGERLDGHQVVDHGGREVHRGERRVEGLKACAAGDEETSAWRRLPTRRWFVAEHERALDEVRHAGRDLVLAEHGLDEGEAPMPRRKVPSQR